MSAAGEISSSSSAAVSADCFASSLNVTSTSTCLISENKKKRKNKKSINQRRFSDEQVRLLETMFELETRLEPRKKQQLARELGLHPRQVAIWFQNKRARWKSKQLERDYSLLHSNYKNLASQFESLKKEKQSLLVQLQKLKDLINKSGEKEEGGQEGRNEAADHPGNRSICDVFDAKPSVPLERSGVLGREVVSDDESSRYPDYLGLDEEEGGAEAAELLNIGEPGESCLTSPGEWGSFDSDVLLDEPSSSIQWWDFWS